MKINFVKIENFLSIKQAYINFDSLGKITRIVGINKDTNPPSSNGAGKSSIIEAIYFALTGKTIRKTTEVTNIKTIGNCRVVLCVNDIVVIERIKYPAKFTVTIDGEDVTGENMTQSMETLFKHLNINPELFLTSMVFGQGNEVSFITATPEQKRSIIQNFLNVQDVFDKRTTIKERKLEAVNSLRVKQAILTEASDQVNKLTFSIDQHKKWIKESNDILSDSYKKDFIAGTSITEIKEKEEQKNTLTQMEKYYGNTIANNKRQMKELIKQHNELGVVSCPKCSHEFTAHQKVKEAIEANVIKLEDENIKHTKARKDCLETLKTMDTPISSQDFELVEKLKGFQHTLVTLEAQRVQVQEKHDLFAQEIYDLNKQYEQYKFWEVVFSEQGIIQYIVSGILEFFNNKINFYLNILSKNSLSLFFNDTLEEKIYNNNEETLFKNLSGGEKRRVTLAIMLALNDLLVLTGKNRSNIIFFDEVADYLDTVGIQGLMELFTTHLSDRKIVVITHNEELAALLEDRSNSLTVVKEKGITEIKFK